MLRLVRTRCFGEQYAGSCLDDERGHGLTYQGLPVLGRNQLRNPLHVFGPAFMVAYRVEDISIKNSLNDYQGSSGLYGV